MYKEHDCDNFNCIYSDYANCDNDNIDNFGEECPQNEKDCELYNCCEICDNQNTCATYNN